MVSSASGIRVSSLFRDLRCRIAGCSQLFKPNAKKWPFLSLKNVYGFPTGPPRGLPSTLFVDLLGIRLSVVLLETVKDMTGRM